MWTSFLAAAVIAPQTTPGITAVELRGSVSTRARMALPPTATVIVSVDRFSPEGQLEVAETRFITGGQQVPYRWRIAFPASHRRQGGQLGVRARIEFGGRIRLESPRHSMVGATAGELALDLVPAAPAPWSVVDVEWQLMSMEGRPLPAGVRAPTLRLNQDGSLNGFSGVNRFGGSFVHRAPGIQIDPGAMTLMAGSPEAMNVESNLIRILPIINRATIESGELVLSLSLIHISQGIVR